jgi:adenylate cyclase
MINANIGWILFLSRDYEGAVAQLEAVTQREPSFAYGWILLGQAYTESGRFEDALRATGRSYELEDWPNVLLHLAYIHARAGRPEEAIRLVDGDQRLRDPLKLAQVFGALGRTDGAFQLLEEGIERHSPFVSELWVEPGYDSIRSDPRWGELMQRLGFPG